MKGKHLWLIGFLISMPVGCSDDDSSALGGPCLSISWSGTATIVSVTEDAVQTSSCVSPMRVVFDFAPNEPSAVLQYQYPAWPDTGRVLRVGDGKLPNESWVISKGLIAGTEHRCLRLETTHGTCTPVNFSFPDIDFSDWADSCYAD